MGKITAPEPLTTDHQTELFDCGVPLLDNWLKVTALKNQLAGASRTFVITDSTRVIGFYALATGSIERASVRGSFARNMPDPISIIILGRLAVDQHHKHQRLGAFLLRDALLRVLRVSDQVGVRGLLVHAISDSAKQFYKQFGFIESTLDDMTLMLSIRHIRQHLAC